MLIHEATFEAAKAKEAVDRRHSTVDEALDVARRMGAGTVLLTHFRWGCRGRCGYIRAFVDLAIRPMTPDQPTNPPIQPP